MSAMLNIVVFLILAAGNESTVLSLIMNEEVAAMQVRKGNEILTLMIEFFHFFNCKYQDLLFTVSDNATITRLYSDGICLSCQ